MPYQTTQSLSMSQSLTSTPDRFSDDAWNLLLSGEQEARRWKHEYFDVEHLLQVLFTNENYRDLLKHFQLTT